MYIALIVLVYVAAVIVLLTPFSSASLLRKPRKHTDPKPNPYRAVSLICELEQCQCEPATGNKRFLQSQAPEIPLAECPAEQCGCRYVHHEDRRGTKDRRLGSRRARADGGFDRRSLRGRRRSDWSLLTISS